MSSNAKFTIALVVLIAAVVIPLTTPKPALIVLMSVVGLCCIAVIQANFPHGNVK